MAFSAGFDAVFVLGGTDISAYLKDVKFSPARKDFDLPVLGGNSVKSMVGPVKTVIDLQGFVDPIATAVFTGHMAENPPASATVAFSPQGTTTGLVKRTCSGFVISYDEHTPSEGPAEFTAKIAVDGLVTYGTN